MRMNPARILSRLASKATGTRRVKTPTVLQMEALECGAASLGIVLAYFGKYVPLEKLRVDCGVSRNGSNAGTLARAARSYGLEVRAFRKEPGQLKELPVPMIVFWNFYHFVVVEGFGKNKVFLNDPATGPRVVDDQAFDDAFTGVVLTFKPGFDFSPGGEKPKFLPILAKWLRGYGTSLLFLFLVGLAIIVPGLAVPVFSRIFVDQVLVRENKSWVIPLLTGMALTAAVQTLLAWIRQRSLIRFELSLSLKNSARFLWHVLHLPMSFHTQRPAGDLAMRVNINDQVAGLLSGQLGNTLLNLFVIAFYAALMCYYSLPLAIITILISLVNLGALRYISRKRVDSNQKMLQDQGRMFGLSSHGLQMIESIKATASESEFFSRWAGYQARLLNIQQRLGLLTQSLQVIPIFLTVFGSLVLLVIGSEFIMQGTMTVGTFVAFQVLVNSFNQPVVSLVNLGSSLQDVQGGLKRIEDVYNYPSGGENAPGSVNTAAGRMVKLEGAVELNNITFGYSPAEPPLIRDFSLRLRPGMRVAIVGRTGCGKSTVASLVGGLYEPWEGEILFDGKRRIEIPVQALHNSIAMVDQNLFLFEGTVRENIAFWDRTISEKEVIHAAQDACIHEEIAARHGAYDSPVGENGRNFSGGQRQRLEIARALSVRPSVLVLDEATSALDALTEQKIDINIRKTGATCLIIAHRLSTIRDCDEIIVMDRGRIVQRGVHKDLMEQKGLYSELIRE